MNFYLGGDVEGAAAASAAALARPCNASMGAFNVDLGRVSSDSSSEEGAVLATMPYVAYLCGYVRSRTIRRCVGDGVESRYIQEVQNLAAVGTLGEKSHPPECRPLVHYEGVEWGAEVRVLRVNHRRIHRDAALPGFVGWRIRCGQGTIASRSSGFA